MDRNAAITVRIPGALKKALEAQARRERRSLSAQIATYLERSVENERVASSEPGRLLGLYAGTRVPSDRDFADVRRVLWGAVGARAGRNGA